MLLENFIEKSNFQKILNGSPEAGRLHNEILQSQLANRREGEASEQYKNKTNYLPLWFRFPQHLGGLLFQHFGVFPKADVASKSFGLTW